MEVLTRKIRVASANGMASGLTTVFFFFPPLEALEAFAAVLAVELKAHLADPSAFARLLAPTRPIVEIPITPTMLTFLPSN